MDGTGEKTSAIQSWQELVAKRRVQPADQVETGLLFSTDAFLAFQTYNGGTEAADRWREGGDRPFGWPADLLNELVTRLIDLGLMQESLSCFYLTVTQQGVLSWQREELLLASGLYWEREILDTVAGAYRRFDRRLDDKQASLLVPLVLVSRDPERLRENKGELWLERQGEARLLLPAAGAMKIHVQGWLE